MSLYERVTDASNQDDTDPGLVLALLHDMRQYWTEPILPTASYRDWAFARLGCPGAGAPDSYEDAETLGRTCLKGIETVGCLLKRHDLMDRYRGELGLAYSGFKCAFELLEREVLGRAVGTHGAQARLPAFINAFHISFMYDMEGFSDLQHLQHHMLRHLLRAGYRRMGTECYREIRVNNVGTHAWEPAMSIEAFVYANIDKDHDAGTHMLATKIGCTVPETVKFLTKCQDRDFAELHAERHLFAFRNGQYDAGNQCYHPPTGPLACSATRVAVRFFDVEFDPSLLQVARWQDIETPLFDSVFLHQDFDPDTLGLVYAMLGRLLYPVGMHDQWQVVPFFKGVAGCGKSTVAAVVSHWFPPKFVSTITNTMEQTFGLAAIVDTYVCLCTEVTSKFPLNRGVWQSMVTGEQIPVPRKYRDPIDQQWDVPLAMFGNELPPFDDKSGSVHRRMAVFAMRKAVDASKVDPTIQSRLRADVGRLLVKCNRAYREMAHDHGHRGLWAPGVVSYQMHAWHKELLQEIDLLTAFMDSGAVVRDPASYISEKDYRAEFIRYLQSRNLTFSERQHWDYDHRTSVLARNGSHTVHDMREYPMGCGTAKTQVYLTNLRITTADDDSIPDMGLVPDGP